MSTVFRVRSGPRAAIVFRRVSKAHTALALLATAALAVGGCAQSPQQLAANPHAKEYFPSSVYGPASRRVVADGQPIPHGGGQYLVGKPYTIAGQTYYPSERKITQVGLASWYGDAFHGRLTANGEIYDRNGFTAAHPTMPLPSYARVTNLRNGYSMVVRVNDRGPYHSNRVMDVSRRVAESLDFRNTGTSKVKVEYVGRASLAGSEDAKLYATLRTNGPAPVGGLEDGMVMAENAPRPAHVASLEPYAPQPPTRLLARSEDDRSTNSETAPRHRREPSRVVSREDEAHEALNLQHLTKAFPPSRPVHVNHGGEAQAPARHGIEHSAHEHSAHEHSMAPHKLGEQNRVRVASHEDSAAGAIAHPLLSAPRLGRTPGGGTKRAEQTRAGNATGASRDHAHALSRPVHTAAAMPAPKQHVSGSHANHARDD